jgi:hypothetical protein
MPGAPFAFNGLTAFLGFLWAEFGNNWEQKLLRSCLLVASAPPAFLLCDIVELLLFCDTQ